MTPRCGVRCRLLQHADVGPLCAVFVAAGVPGSRRGLNLTPQPKATPQQAPTGCMSLLVCECAKISSICP